jgi:hypothetical protein
LPNARTFVALEAVTDLSAPRHQDLRMDATSQAIPASAPEPFKSRPGALIWSFRKSRDGWKRKYQAVKAAAEADRNRIADLTKSRQQWRAKAERAAERLSASEAEVAGLRDRMAAADGGKKGVTAAR